MAVCVLIISVLSILAHLSRSRYKIVVQTTVGQLRDQGIRVASRCLWDPNTDNYASTSYSNVSFRMYDPCRQSFALVIDENIDFTRERN